MSTTQLELCRLCMCDTILLDIFCVTDLNDLIASFLGICITALDDISTKICQECFTKLSDFRDYREKCHEVQQALANLTTPTTAFGELNQPIAEYALVTNMKAMKLIPVITVTSEPESLADDRMPTEPIVEFTPAPQECGSLPMEPTDACPVSPSSAKPKRSESLTGKRRYVYDFRKAYESQLLKCDICGKRVVKNRMDGHRNVHLGLRPLQCEREGCEQRFHCQQLRLHHYRNAHAGQPHCCDLCGKMLRSRRSLGYHKRDIHGEKKFACSYCDQQFVSNARLNQHLKYHRGERNHPCSLCDYSFYSSNDLKKHLRTHDRRRPGRLSASLKFEQRQTLKINEQQPTAASAGVELLVN